MNNKKKITKKGEKKKLKKDEKYLNSGSNQKLQHQVSCTDLFFLLSFISVTVFLCTSIIRNTIEAKCHDKSLFISLSL